MLEDIGINDLQLDLLVGSNPPLSSTFNLDSEYAGPLYELIDFIPGVSTSIESTDGPLSWSEVNLTRLDLNVGIDDSINIINADVFDSSNTYSNNYTYTGYQTDQGDPIFETDDGTYFVVHNPSLGVFDSSGDVIAANFVLCLLPETLIKLADHQLKKAGDLEIGDLLATSSGPKPVKFIGRTTRNLIELRKSARMPVHISAGSLGDLGPEHSIHCTPSHAFYIKGSLVEAQALVNGSTVTQLDDWNEFTITYISIELEDHSLVWANGLLTETYFANWRNNGFSRQSWDNYDQYLELYGESNGMKELDMPRIPFARQLPAELRLMLQLNESNQALQSV